MCNVVYGKSKASLSPTGSSLLASNSSFCSMKWFGVLLLFLDGKLVRVTPSAQTIC